MANLLPALILVLKAELRTEGQWGKRAGILWLADMAE